MDRPTERRSINRRLTLTVFATTAVSLFLACLAFVVYDVVTMRQSMTRNAATLAEVIGINSAVALAFEDSATATETLGALGAVPAVVAAVIYDRSGRPFARYESQADSPAGFDPPRASAEGHRFHDGHLHLFRRITFDGETVGTIYIQSDTRELAVRIQRYLVLVAALLAVVAGFALMTSSRLRRVISRPLAELAGSAEAIADGDLSAQVVATSDDEIGVLARTFNAMAAGLRELVGHVRASTRDVSEVSRSLLESAAGMSRAAQRQQAATDQAAESMERVGASICDVGENVEQLATSAGDASASIVQMDASIASVAEKMDFLAESIDTTSVGVSQVAGNIDQVVGGVETLQSATDATLIRLRQLSGSVQHVKDDAEQSHALSEDSREEASRGMRAVKETIAAMGEISTSFDELQRSVSRLASESASIDEILGVIRDVADQTSLLSLNAAIIAAQAGEHGSAFKVVAEEVSSLAQHTQRSTREIAQLIQAVQAETAAAVAAAEEGSEKVKKGVQRSHVAGEVLNEIIEKSDVSTERVRRIVGATARQTRDLESVERSMLEVKQIVEQIHESARDQHRATTEIAAAIEKIRALGQSVRRATDEQRKGSRLITDTSTKVASRLGQIAEATQAQTKDSETIQHALQVFRDVTEETARRAQILEGMVTTLSERSAHLEQEINRFKTGAEGGPAG